MSSHGHTHSHHHHEQHVHGGPKLYGFVLGALLVLTVITVIASTVDWGAGLTNVIIAMLIASAKASLVALFFMHLRWDKPMNAIIFCSTLFFLGIFLIGCYTDATARPMLEPTNLRPATPAPTTTPGQAAPGQGAAGQAGPGAGHGATEAPKH